MRTCGTCQYVSFIGPYYSCCDHKGDSHGRPTFKMGPAPDWCPLDPTAAMASYTITIDGVGYRGLDADLKGHLTPAYGNEPVPIESAVNVWKCLEYILDSIRYNTLEPKEIIIRRVRS